MFFLSVYVFPIVYCKILNLYPVPISTLAFSFYFSFIFIVEEDLSNFRCLSLLLLLMKVLVDLLSYIFFCTTSLKGR